MLSSSQIGNCVPVIQSPWVLDPVPSKSACVVEASPSNHNTTTSSVVLAETPGAPAGP